MAPDFWIMIGIIMVVAILRSAMTMLVQAGAKKFESAPGSTVQDKAKELDRFLQELGVKPKDATNEPGQRPRPAAPEVKQRKPAPEVRKKPKPKPERLEDHHLKTSFDQRHLQPTQSTIDSTRMEPLRSESALPTALGTARSTTPRTRRPANRSTVVSPAELLQMIQGRGMRNAFILKEVLGEPLALRQLVNRRPGAD